MNAASRKVQSTYLTLLLAGAKNVVPARNADSRTLDARLPNLLGSSGGVVSQPALGRAADISGYPLSYLICAAIQACGLPFLAIARRLGAKSDSMAGES